MSVEKRIAEMERLRREASPGKWMAAESGSSVIGWPIISIPEGHAIASVLSNPRANAAHIISAHNGQEALLRIVRAAEVMLGAPAIEEAYVKAEYELRDALDDFATEAEPSKTCECNPPVFDCGGYCIKCRKPAEAKR